MCGAGGADGEIMNEALQPLSGIKVVDFGVGMPAALAVKLLADAGAEVVRFEPPQGDPFYAIHPAYAIWQRGKRILPATPGAEAAALRDADICVIGGEDHPDLIWERDLAAIRAATPGLILLAIRGAPAGWGGPGIPAVELFAQARSGIAFEHYPDRPLHHALPVGSYGAALHGVIAALAALWARAERGGGETIDVSLVQGAARWCASVWADVERPPPSFATLSPKGVVPMRFQCADGGYVALAPGVPGSMARLYDILGIDDPTIDPTSRGSPTGGGDPRSYFGNVDLIAPYVLTWQLPDLIEALKASGLPGAVVTRAGDCWDDAQTRHNGLIVGDDEGWEWVGLPVAVDGEVAAVPAAAAPRTAAAGGAGPLAGVRIVDLGSFAAGPHASVVLGDLGAEVVKIERIEGDPMRSQFHHYAASNRGKRSIAIDAKSPEGARVIKRICGQVDAVHHNFRPGVSARLGVDRQTLKRTSPAIVVLESPAYGPTGPKAALPGFDSVFQAVSGHQPGAGGAGNPPLSYRFAPIDYGTGVIGALGIMLGLLHRQRHGAGAAVYSSLLNAGVFLLSEVVRRPDGSFAGVPINDATQLGAGPAEGFYRTADGWIAVAARGAPMAARFARALACGDVADHGVSDWGEDERSRFAAALLTRTSAAALELLAAADVWAQPCTTHVADLLDDPLFARCGGLVLSDDPEMGHVRQVGRPVTFSDRPPSLEGRGRLDPIGGHSREILAEYGFSATETDALFARGVVA